MELALVINTHSSLRDVWNPFLDSVRTHIPQINPKYIFVDKTNFDFGDDFTIINYDTNVTYRDQFYESIKQVKEKYCIYIAEDYILYDDVQWDNILKQLKILDENKELSFVKLIGGGTEFSVPYKNYENLFLLDNQSKNFYTNQATIWKTRDLEKIYELSPPSHIADKGNMQQMEPNGYKACRQMNMNGVVYYNGEKKRGLYHHDSSIFPYIATALVKGKWNMSEYQKELDSIFVKYNINPFERGIY